MMTVKRWLRGPGVSQIGKPAVHRAKVDLKGKPYEYILPTYPSLLGLALFEIAVSCINLKSKIQENATNNGCRVRVKLVVLTELKEASEIVAEVLAYNPIPMSTWATHPILVSK